MKYFVKARISENISETHEGFLLCLAVPIARTGIQVYGPGETPLELKDGKVDVDRPEAEVFRPETIASFEGKPITITHPEEFVNPANWKALAVGTMQNVRRGDGDFNDSLIADLLITDHVAIQLVKNGLREVSCGYTADYEQDEPGLATQLGIIGNHLALVQQGRAGASYAINDHIGKVPNMTLKEKFKKLRAQFTDLAAKAADADKELGEMAKDESLGGEQSAADPSSGQPAMAKDALEAMDALKKACDSLAAVMGKSKADDADEEPPVPKKKKEDAPADDADEEAAPAADEEEEGEASIESRMKKLEAAVSTILEKMSGDEGEVGDEEEMEDADEEEVADEEEGAMVGDSHRTNDTASRAEILAPGIAVDKNVKLKALKAAYATKDGKAIIHMLSANKEPNWKDAAKVGSLFVAASEMLKLKRVNDNAKTKQVRDNGLEPHAGAVKSADDINAINAKHYGLGH